MTNLRLFNPWGSVISPFFEDFDVNLPRSGAFPPVDMFEDGDNLVVRVELSGFSPNDVQLSIENGMIRISGSKRTEKKKEDKKRKYYVSEIYDRSFTRSIPLPVDVDDSKANATFENGVLVVTLPKTQKEKKKLIPIKINKK